MHLLLQIYLLRVTVFKCLIVLSASYATIIFLDFLFYFFFFNPYSTNCHGSCPSGSVPEDGSCYRMLNADLHVITFRKFVLQTVIENVNAS